MRHPLFHFSPVFSFRAVFLLIFLFYRPSCTFSVFIDLFDFYYNFSVFMVLIFFPLPRSFILFLHLSGLLFLFVNNHFFLFINIFIPSLRFLSLIAISHHFLCLSLPLLPVFILSPMSILHFPFQSFFAFSQLIFIFLLFLPLPSFYKFFAIF